MARRPSLVFRFSLGILVLTVAAAGLGPWWLPAIGRVLVRDDGPAKADLAVVLGGDTYGHRVQKAAELVRQGYVPKVLVSGLNDIYGVNESDLAIALAVRRGYPADWFIPFPNGAVSTRQEAELILPELRRRNVHSFLLVTNNFHTGRAARIFRAGERASGGGPPFRVVAAPDEFFQPSSWWKSRQAQKTVFMEWSKTVATAVGL